MQRKILFFLLTFFLFGTQTLANEMDFSTQQTPFGEVQFISCTTDLRNSGPLYLGVRIIQNQEWQLDNPNLKITASEPLPATIFTPFKQPHPDAPIYPISVSLPQKATNPITFFAEGTWHACKGEECITEPIHLSLTLGTKLSFFTPACSHITLALSNTPIPMYSEKIKAYARKQQPDKVEILLDFEKVPRTLMIYDQNKEPLKLDIQIDKKRAKFVLPNTTDSIHFFVRTYYHYYDVQPIMLAPNEKFPDVSISLLQILQACFLFFILSAVPIYWTRVHLSSQKQFRIQAKRAFILTLFLGTLLISAAALYEYQTGNLIPLLIQPINAIFAIISMILGLIFVPSSSIFMFLFLIITPHPYLTILNSSSNILLKLTPLISFILLTLIAFGIQFLFSKKFFKLLTGKNVSKIWWVVRLPWFALILYTLFHL